MEKEKEAAASAATSAGPRARGGESEEKSKTGRKNYTEGGVFISAARME